eukprot:UN07661
MSSKMYIIFLLFTIIIHTYSSLILALSSQSTYPIGLTGYITSLLGSGYGFYYCSNSF